MDSSLNLLPDTQQWYVAQCQHLHEWRAASAIEQLLGLKVYVPELRRRVGGKSQYTPFFPGYMFVYADLYEVAPSQINAAPGMIRLVTFEGYPQAIASTVVDRIREHVDDLNMRGGVEMYPFQPGDMVRLKRGPMQGLEGLFLGSPKPSERVRILIEFLGRQSTALVNIHHLEAVGGAAQPDAPAKRERRTRGRGRVINH